MLREILIKTCEILNKQDIIYELKNNDSVENITNTQLQSDVYKLISFYNFIVQSIFQNYIDMTHTENIISDENNRIEFYNLSYEPIEIISVSDDNRSHCCANVFCNYILTNQSNKKYTITYKYLPEELHDINDKLNIPKLLLKRIICYGIASEYFASKNLFKESDYWKNYFMYEIFKLKTHKERRLKSTFRI